MSKERDECLRFSPLFKTKIVPYRKKHTARTVFNHFKITEIKY